MCIQNSFCLLHEFQLSQLGTYIQKETQKQYNFRESSFHNLRCLKNCLDLCHCTTYFIYDLRILSPRVIPSHSKNHPQQQHSVPSLYSLNTGTISREVEDLDEMAFLGGLW